MFHSVLFQLKEFLSVLFVTQPQLCVGKMLDTDMMNGLHQLDAGALGLILPGVTAGARICALLRRWRILTGDSFCRWQDVSFHGAQTIAIR